MPKFGKAGEKRPKLFDITRKEIAEEENQVHCESDCALEEQAIQQESGETQKSLQTALEVSKTSVLADETCSFCKHTHDNMIT